MSERDATARPTAPEYAAPGARSAVGACPDGDRVFCEPMPVVVCGDAGFVAVSSHEVALRGRPCRVFQSGERCRAFVAQQDHALVLVGPRLIDVAPVNLVAAITRDRGARAVTVVLFSQGMPSGSLASRAMSAGVAAVFPEGDPEVFAQLLSEPADHPEAVGPASAVPASGATAASAVETAGRLVTVVSARGGSGRTTTALLTSMAFALAGCRSALVDFDLRFGEMDQLMGLHDIPRLDALVGDGADGTDDALRRRLAVSGTPIDGEVVLYPAPRLPERGDALIPHTLSLMAALRSLYAVTVVDTGGDWNAEHAQLVKASDCVLLVMDQRGSSLEGAQRALDLCVRLGVPLAHIHGVLDRCSRKGGVDPVSASVALRGLPVHTVDDGGPEVDELMGLGCPRELFILRNPCAVSITAMVEQLAPLMGVEWPLHAHAAASGSRKGRARRVWGGLAS